MELRQFVRAGFTASETAQFEELYRQLQGYFAREVGVGWLLGNINIGQKNLDAILLTNHWLVGIEFKNFGGSVEITGNSWVNTAENGSRVVVEGGASNKTPLEQAVINHNQLSHTLASYKNLPVGDFMQQGGVPYFIVFNRNMRVNDPNRLLEGPRWLRVTDNANFTKRLREVQQDIRFTDQEVENFKRHLGLIGESVLPDKYELALNLFNLGDYRGALNELNRVGANAKATLLRGRCYYLLGRQQDAVREITQARMAGLPYAKYMLGKFMWTGYGPVQKNPREALILLRESMNEGVREAMDLLEKIIAEDKAREQQEAERKRQEAMNQERGQYSAQIQTLVAAMVLGFAYVGCLSVIPMGITWELILSIVGWLFMVGYILSYFNEDFIEVYKELGAWLEKHSPLRAPALDGRVGMVPVNDWGHWTYPFFVFFALLPLAGIYLAFYFVLDIDWLWYHVNFKYFPLMSFLLKAKGFFLSFGIAVLAWGGISCLHCLAENTQSFVPRPSGALMGYWWRLSVYGLKASLIVSALVIAGRLIFG